MGGEVHTPNLDRLAASGLRFTQFYNTARCCPSRASMLTGLHPHQTGVGHMMGDDGLEGYRGDLNDRCITIADAVRSEGYGTYMSGKWHISRHTGPDGPKHSWPCQRGFDEYYGIITGAANFWKPNTLTRSNTRIQHDELPEGYFFTDAVSDEAATYIRNHVDKTPERPFLLTSLIQHHIGPCMHTKKTSPTTMDVLLQDGTNSEKNGSRGCGR